MRIALMMVLNVGECYYISYVTGMSIYVDLMDITLFYIFDFVSSSLWILFFCFWFFKIRNNRYRLKYDTLCWWKNPWRSDDNSWSYFVIQQFLSSKIGISVHLRMVLRLRRNGNARDFRILFGVITLKLKGIDGPLEAD